MGCAHSGKTAHDAVNRTNQTAERDERTKPRGTHDPYAEQSRNAWLQWACVLIRKTAPVFDVAAGCATPRLAR